MSNRDAEEEDGGETELRAEHLCMEDDIVGEAEETGSNQDDQEATTKRLTWIDSIPPDQSPSPGRLPDRSAEHEPHGVDSVCPAQFTEKQAECEAERGGEDHEGAAPIPEEIGDIARCCRYWNRLLSQPQ